MGESINLVNNFKVKQVIFNNDEYNNLELNLIKQLQLKDIDYYREVKEININGNNLYFLNNKLYDSENDNSNVIYMTLNNVKVLLMGDASTRVEADLLASYNLTDIDILKVGHHGSNTSTSKYFIDIINPSTCLISVGENNKYGHPDDSVLNTINNCYIYRTNLNESIMFKIKNNDLKVETHIP